MRSKTKRAAAVYPQERCRDCRHAHDFHSPAVDGHMTLCVCEYDARSEYGKWSTLTSDYACGRFARK